MTRWRITAYVKAKKHIRVRKYWQTDCKLCAIAKAMEIAEEVAQAKHVHVSAIGWTAEKLMGVVNGWEIKFHDGQRVGPLPKRHGH